MARPCASTPPSVPLDRGLGPERLPNPKRHVGSLAARHVVMRSLAASPGMHHELRCRGRRVVAYVPGSRHVRGPAVAQRGGARGVWTPRRDQQPRDGLAHGQHCRSRAHTQDRSQTSRTASNQQGHREHCETG